MPPLRDEEPLRGQEASRGQEPSQAPELRRTPEPPAPEQEPPAFEEPEESARIATGTYRQIRDYSLVLLSQGIVHRFLRSEEGPFEIFVVPEVEARAREQLELYSRENPPKEENPPLPLSLSIQPAWVLLVPVVCTILDFGNFVDRMHFAGLSDASKVLHGEWWRTITALTLHGDARHIASNLVSGYIVLNLMSYRIPLARMAPFLAVASAVANFFVAFTVQSDYRALGFSTFVFAAIGSLAVIEFRLMPKETHGMLRRFAPCAARPRSPYSSGSAKTPTFSATPTASSRAPSAGSSHKKRRSAGERLLHLPTSYGSLSISPSSSWAGSSHSPSPRIHQN